MVTGRQKRSISLPPELDEAVQTAAEREGLTYSAWLANLIRKELTIRRGLRAVGAVKRGQKGPSIEELSLARHWAEEVQRRGKRSGTRPRKSD